MANTAYGPDLSLSSDQQNLLRTALSSNPHASPQSAPRPSNGTNGNHQNQSPMANGAGLYKSPGQDFNGSLTDSPLFDDLDDANFEWDNNGEQLFGDIGENDYDETGDLHDKRKASTGSDDGEASKRQEGDAKTPKKPGRKPLTAEPTTKRKAQNRAAQRAFRDRKERHLKDLEVKVDDLEKASEATNHENGRLRAQVEKLNVELKEYRKRLSLNSTGASHSPPPQTQRNFYDSNNDFSFAFPQFGDLPASFLNNGKLAKTSTVQPQNSTAPGPVRRTSGNTISPTNTSIPFGPPTTASPQSFENFSNDSLNSLTGLFSPSVLETASRSNSTEYGFPSGQSTTGSIKNGSFSNAFPPKVHRASSASTANSPASSMRFDSSVGTTPEPTVDSPPENTKPDPVLNTISEEINTLPEGKRKLSAAMSTACGSSSNPVPLMLSDAKSPSTDINGIDWMAAQNGGAFDPVLFGDYRDPQDNIVNSLGDDFFTDAFPSQDFASPYNTGDALSSPAQPKHDLMAEIEKTQDSETVPADDAQKNYIGCDKLWERVQQSQKFQSGEAEMDGLCSDLKKKAKCSGKGAVIDEKEVDKILGPKQAEQKTENARPMGGGMFGNFIG